MEPMDFTSPELEEDLNLQSGSNISARCSGPKCILCGNYRTKCPNKKFYRFPKDAEMSDKWAHLSQLKWVINASVAVRNSKFLICGSHFTVDAFTSISQCRLKKTALPVCSKYLAVLIPVIYLYLWYI